jgi:hypothetical protein
MELELIPDQPPEIGKAVADLLHEGLPDRRRTPDPWWQAGVDEALEPSGRQTASDVLRPRRTPGAARA